MLINKAYDNSKRGFKMNFKKYLNENIANDHAVKFFDARTLTLIGLLTAYKNAGYDVTRQDEKTFGALYYKGYKKTSGHMYAVVCEDSDIMDEEDGKNFYVADFWVSLNEDGKIEAEPGGRPLVDEVTELEAVKFADNYKMK